MPPPNPKAAPPKSPKPVKLSREAVTLAGAIYALRVADELRERQPLPAKLEQIKADALTAAKVFEPALLEAVDSFDDAIERGPRDGEPLGNEPTPPITTRGGGAPT